MSESHTSGPWTVLPEEVGRYYTRIRGTCIGHRYKVANVLNYPCDNQETRANALLMAAAPEMLAALKKCRAHMHEHASNTPDGAFDAMCAAIDKATGAEA